MEYYYEPVKCINCGKEFEKRSPTHVFCSEECKEEAYQRGCETVDDLNKVPEEERSLWKKCANCGKWFKPFAVGTTQKCCCAACQYKAKKAYAKAHQRERTLAAARKKRAKQVEAASRRIPKDGISWDDIRAVLAEGISSYHEAVKIADQRRRERETLLQAEKEGKA